jgi:hypothetical protein
MSGVSPVAESGAIIDDVTIRVSVCVRSSGHATTARRAMTGATTKAASLRLDRKNLLKSTLQGSFEAFNFRPLAMFRHIGAE